MKIGGCGYLYKKTEDKHTLIADPKDKGWYEHLRGKPIYEAQDTGNGIEFKQRNKNRLDYDEAQELFFLLKKML